MYLSQINRAAEPGISSQDLLWRESVDKKKKIYCGQADLFLYIMRKLFLLIKHPIIPPESAVSLSVQDGAVCIIFSFQLIYMKIVLSRLSSYYCTGPRELKSHNSVNSIGIGILTTVIWKQIWSPFLCLHHYWLSGRDI